MNFQTTRKKIEGVLTMNCFARRFAAIALLLFFASLGSGCHDTAMKKFTVNVKIGDDLLESMDVAESKSSNNKYPNIEVDIIGASDHDFAYWSNIKMSDYWDYTPDGKPSAARAGATKFTIKLGSTDGLALPIDDEIWDKWKEKNVTSLFVMSSYPRAGEDLTGDTDTRRAIIPLNPDRWDKHLDHVDVHVSRTRVIVDTPMKTDKP